MRSAIFILVGAVFLMAATFFYGFVFLAGAMQEPAFRLVIGGTLVGGVLGLLVAAMTRPSGTGQTQLILTGAVGGLLAGLVYGVVGLEEAACGPGFGHAFCGWVFLGRLFMYPWMPIALWSVFGGVAGALLGSIAARFARGGQSSLPAGAESR